MSPNGSENNRIFVKMKGETVLHGDGAFPSILNSLDFLNPERWVVHVAKKQRKLFFERLSDLLRQSFVLFLKPIAEAIPFYLSNHSKPSSAV